MKKLRSFTNTFFDKYLIRTVLILFIFQAYYFVFTLKIGMPADEEHHILVSLMHKDSLNPFIEEPEILGQFITISTTPFLYHYLLGLLSNLNFYNLPLAIVMRLFNPMLSLATLIIVYKTSYLITKDKCKSLLSMILLASTLMFVFSSGVVNYDNLANLISISSIYFFIRFFQNFKFQDLLNLVIIVLLGFLTKFTIFPLAFIISLLTLWVIIKNRYKIKKGLRDFWKNTHKIKKGLYFLTLIIVTSLFAMLYGKNIIKYHSFIPGCDVVASHEECYEYSFSYKVYYDGFVSDIDNDADMDSINDVKEWIRINLTSIFGTLTHRGTFFRIYSIIPFTIIVALAIFGFLRSIANKERIKAEIVLVGIIFIFYGLVLFYHNYNEYLASSVWNGTQGRYFFPVWPLLYIIIAQYALNFKKNLYKQLIILIFFIVTIFTSFGIYYFFKPADYQLDWHEIATYENFYGNLD